VTYNAYRTQQYREQEVLGASPVHVLVMTYDVAIQACEQRNLARAMRALGVLRNALDMDQGEVALGLYRLYQWCEECLRQGEYAQAGRLLRSLRDAWAAVEKQQAASVAHYAAERAPQMVGTY
jgi:flagellin-specific chaperone FliS